MGFLVQSDCLGKLCALIGPAHHTHPVKDAPANGILLHADGDGIVPTVFNSKRLATMAITRTKKWRATYGWKTGDKQYIVITEQQWADQVESSRMKINRKKK